MLLKIQLILSRMKCILSKRSEYYLKLTHAEWEKRNMGVDCWEVLVEHDDTPEELREKAYIYETEYTVVKVPVGMMDICFHLQSAGYIFMETMTFCHREAELLTLGRIQQRIVDNVTYTEMDLADKKLLFDEIENGLFKDDRVSLDPYFTQKQANNRYIGWITDETNRGGQIYKLVYRNNDIGFFTFKVIDEKVCYPYIAGVYKNYQSFGFGFCMNYFEIKEALARNMRRINSAYSSNNRGASAIHLSMGYILNEQYYVFIKHK